MNFINDMEIHQVIGRWKKVQIRHSTEGLEKWLGGWEDWLLWQSLHLTIWLLSETWDTGSATPPLLASYAAITTAWGYIQHPKDGSSPKIQTWWNLKQMSSEFLVDHSMCMWKYIYSSDLQSVFVLIHTIPLEASFMHLNTTQRLKYLYNF